MIGFWCSIYMYCIVEATKRLFISRNENVRKNGIGNVNAGEKTFWNHANSRGWFSNDSDAAWRIVLRVITATLMASRLNVGHACYLVVCFIWFYVGMIKIITLTASSKLLANWNLSTLFDTPLHHFTSPVENIFFLRSKFVTSRKSRFFFYAEFSFRAG